MCQPTVSELEQLQPLTNQTTNSHHQIQLQEVALTHYSIGIKCPCHMLAEDPGKRHYSGWIVILVFGFEMSSNGLNTSDVSISILKCHNLVQSIVTAAW